jgi:hypothetical protein
MIERSEDGQKFVVWSEVVFYDATPKPAQGDKPQSNPDESPGNLLGDSNVIAPAGVPPVPVYPLLGYQP